MRVFVAGASGAIGTRLVAQLVDHGHEVIGTFRSPGHAASVKALGAQPVALDLLDRGAVRQAVLEAGPEAIAHEATALADLRRLQALRPQLPSDEQAADRGHRRAAGRRARGGRAPVRRPELRQRPLRARGRAGQERGRSARLTPVPAARESFAAMRHVEETP